ncbi:hypothetical protein CAP36_08830 [Chitinophagaceae bacterium IBVUCB2]|nr:hypothetical protein CAP36_08830 [Chitinophagaceae bacterium IBVUCB2]
MKKSVKTLALITISFLFTTFSNAQLKLPGLNSVANDIKKVIEDYPNRFINLMGEVQMQNTQSTDYHCNFTVNGAEEAFITRYPAKKEICSWQAVMLTTDNFDKARQKFKLLFNQLNNLSVKAGTGTFKLKADYESPEESKKFTSILFSFEPANESVKKLKVEISMQYIEPMEWKVKVLIYDRDREDDERGAIKE